jgi:hypothetical protein
MKESRGIERRKGRKQGRGERRQAERGGGEGRREGKEKSSLTSTEYFYDNDDLMILRLLTWRSW